MENLTEKEILTISECILNTMHNMEEAQKMVIGNNVKFEICSKIEELRVLNNKVLRQIDN